MTNTVEGFKLKILRLIDDMQSEKIREYQEEHKNEM